MRNITSSSVATDEAVVVQRIKRAAARCVQCGQEIKTVPFNITNVIMCKNCYGDQYYNGKGRGIFDDHSDIGSGDVAASDLSSSY